MDWIVRIKRDHGFKEGGSKHPLITYISVETASPMKYSESFILTDMMRGDGLTESTVIEMMKEKIINRKSSND